MPIVGDIKRIAEKLTGVGQPSDAEAAGLIRKAEAQTFLFGDDGETPNNPTCPLLVYPSAVALPAGLDPAAVFEKLFASNGWGRGWRNGIFDFVHFHAQVHEVLGIARGETRVRFGGAKGKVITVKAGDVVVLPAGTGHQRVAPAKDLLVVGAYPPEGQYDQHQPDDIDPREARRRISRVPVPKMDPLHGERGPLRELWKVHPASG